MERKERKDHAKNKALVLLAISKGIDTWREITQEVGITQRATFDILKEMEKEKLIESKGENNINPHNTKKKRYQFSEQGPVGSILTDIRVWNLIYNNANEGVEKFMSSERYQRMAEDFAELVFCFQDTHIPFGYIVEVNCKNGEDKREIDEKVGKIVHSIHELIKEPYENASKADLDAMINNPEAGHVLCMLTEINSNVEVQERLRDDIIITGLSVIRNEYRTGKLKGILIKLLLSSPEAMSYTASQIQALVEVSRIPDRYKENKFTKQDYEDKFAFVIESVLTEGAKFEENELTFSIKNDSDFYLNREKQEEWVQKGFNGDITIGMFFTWRTQDKSLFVDVYLDWLTEIILSAFVCIASPPVVIPKRYIRSYLLS